MKLQKEFIRRMYELESEGSPLLDRYLSSAARTIYPILEKHATYRYNGERRFCTGGTPALNQTVNCFVEFIKAYDSGHLEFRHFDAVIWACHNNGTFADCFIDCADECDAMQFLNELSGTVRN